MKLNLDKPLKGLDGEPILEPDGSPVMMSKMVANMLAGAKSDEPVKMLDFAITLFKEGSIQVDATDLEKIKEKLTASEFTDLARGQILKVIKATETKDVVHKHNAKEE